MTRYFWPRPSTLIHGPAVYGNDWSKWTCATYHSVTSSPSSDSSPTYAAGNGWLPAALRGENGAHSPSW